MKSLRQFKLGVARLDVNVGHAEAGLAFVSHVFLAGNASGLVHAFPGRCGFLPHSLLAAFY